MPTERRSAPSHLAAGLLLEAPREPARAGLPACSRPAFTDPPADRLQSLRGFCHLKGRDQPFEAQLQTARVSFGEQLRITFVGPRRIAHDGTSGSRLSRKNPPSRGRRLSGERVKRVHEAALTLAPRHLRSGAARFCSFLRRPAAWKLASELAFARYSPRTDRNCRYVSACNELVSPVKRRSADRAVRLG